MALTFSRWLVLVVLLCGATVAFTMPFDARMTFDDIPRDSALVRLNAVAARARAARGRLEDVGRDYRVRRMLDRVPAPGALVMLDPSVPVPARRAIDSTMGVVWRAVGPGASPSRSGVLVFHGDAFSGERAFALPAPARVDVMRLLPEASGDGRCLVLVQLSQHAAVTDTERLLGPCGFWAVFGPPGRGVRAWLGRTGFVLARAANWQTADTTMPVTSWQHLSPDGGACLTSGGQACLDAIGLRRDTVGLRAKARRYRGSAVAIAPAPDEIDMVSLGEREAHFLADMVRDLGNERFRAFWTSDADPEQAFADAAGRSLSEWTRAWLSRSTTPPRRAAQPSVGDAVWLAVALPLLMVAAVRPRDRVM